MKVTIALLSPLFATINGTAQNTVLNKLVESVSETSLKTILDIIACNEFEGRMAGSKGDSLAVTFISSWFNNHHIINPYQKTEPYLQSVPLIHSNYSTSTLAIDGKSFVLDNQWTYFNGSNNFNVTSAEVVFIGYGISTTNFDELKGIDIEGKVVVMMPELPNISTANSIIDEKDLPDQGQRIMNIISKKPLAVLIYTPQFINILNELKAGRKFLPYFKYQDLEIPPAYPISSDIANLIVNGNIDSIYKSILQTGKPNSFNTNKTLTLSINRKDEPANTNNIVGVINGTNENLPCIVLTAHHDHEGIVDNLTYFGADDNGSGTNCFIRNFKNSWRCFD